MVGIRNEPIQYPRQNQSIQNAPGPSSSTTSVSVEKSAPTAAPTISAIIEDMATSSSHESATIEPNELSFGQLSQPSSSNQTSQMSRPEVTQFLTSQLGESFQSLPPAQQEQLINTVQSMNMTPEDLMTQTMQGANQIGSIVSSLDQLITTGRLTPEVLSAMSEMTTADMTPALNAQRPLILQSALHEIAHPECIAQHNKGTCAATVPQDKLALENPERYLRLITDLSSPSGEVSTDLARSQNGITMRREPGTTLPDGSFRSITSRLIQPAFMEYANGQLDYNNASDQHSDASGGLSQSQTMALMTGLFGADAYQSLSLQEGNTPEEMVEQMKPFLDAGVAIPVGMIWSSSGQHTGHEIMLTGIDTENNTAYFYNPWGELKSMPLDVLTPRLLDCCIPTSMEHASTDSMSNLPMGDFSNYEPMTMAEFNPQSHFESLDNLTDEQLDSINGILEDSDLSDLDIGNLDSLVDNSPEQILDEILESLSNTDSLTDLSTELDIQSNLSLLSEEERNNWLPLFNQWQQDSGVTNEDVELHNLFDAIQNEHINPTDFSQLLERTDLTALSEQLSLSDDSKPITNELTALFNQLHHNIHGEGTQGQTTQELIQETIDKLEELSQQEHNIEEALSQLRRIIGDNIIQQQQQQPTSRPFQLIDF